MLDCVVVAVLASFMRNYFLKRFFVFSLGLGVLLSAWGGVLPEDEDYLDHFLYVATKKVIRRESKSM